MISNDRLRDWSTFGYVPTRDVRAMAAELLAARERIDELSDDSTSWESRAMEEEARAEKAEAQLGDINAALAETDESPSGVAGVQHHREVIAAFAVMVAQINHERDAARAEVERLRGWVGTMRDALRFYDKARASGDDGALTGAVSDGLDWVIDAAREIARAEKAEAKLGARG